MVAATTGEAFGAAAGAATTSCCCSTRSATAPWRTVRVAERAWRDLAGEDPVEDVEAVVRRFDPQRQDALEIAQDTVGARAVSTLQRHALDQWTEGWKSLGFDEPAVAPDAMAAVVKRGTAAVVLTGGAVDRAEAIAHAAPAAPVLAVEIAGERRLVTRAS